MSISPTLAEKVWLFTQNSDGTLSPAVLSGGGGSGTPGGTPTQLQFNNTVFGGVPGSVVDATTGEITLTTATGPALNIVQQDFAAAALNVNDGALDTVQFYTIGGTASFNVTDSSGDSINADASSGTATLDVTDSNSGSAVLSSTSGFPSLVLTDVSSISATFSETGISCSAALNLSSGTDIDIVAGTGFAVDASTTVVILNEGMGGSQYTDTGGGGIQFDASGHNVELNLTSGGTLSIHGTHGVTAGPFTVVSSIQVINGIVTVLTGS